MPQLVKLQEELKDSGFVIVAPHAQAGTQDEVTALLRKNKVNYTVTSSGSIPDNPVSGIPAAFLFATSGNLIEKGTPSGMHKKIQDLVKSEPHFLAAGMKYTKLASVADALKKTKLYGPILKKLDKDKTGSGPPAEEAKYLSGRIQAYGQKRLEAAKALEAEDPYEAMKEYNEVAQSWGGVETGDKAKARLKELKDDKDFQSELKAADLLHAIMADCEKLVPSGSTINLDYASNKKFAANVRAGAAALKKKFPNAKATARLATVLKPYGFT